jgi:hypothetical protein
VPISVPHSWLVLGFNGTSKEHFKKEKKEKREKDKDKDKDRDRDK